MRAVVQRVLNANVSVDDVSKVELGTDCSFC